MIHFQTLCVLLLLLSFFQRRKTLEESVKKTFEFLPELCLIGHSKIGQ